MSVYATRSDLKAWLRIESATTEFDTQLDDALEDASRCIDQATSRSFDTTLSVAAPRYYTPEWDRATGRLVVQIDDLQSVTSLAVDYDSDGDGTYATSIVVADTRLYPLNATADGKPWSQLSLPTDASISTGVEGSIRVTAKWGWTAVPGPVKQACLMQAARFFVRKDSTYGMAGTTDGGFGETRLLAALDPDVRLSLKTVMRYWAARGTGSSRTFGWLNGWY